VHLLRALREALGSDETLLDLVELSPCEVIRRGDGAAAHLALNRCCAQRCALCLDRCRARVNALVVRLALRRLALPDKVLPSQKPDVLPNTTMIINSLKKSLNLSSIQSYSLMK
jgi:hypothetical protein